MTTKYKIGAFQATSLVAGNMIGSGVLLAPALLAPYGFMSLVGWILTTIGALALALVFSRLSGWIPQAGGPYTFTKHVFGDFIGFQMAWGYWISALCGNVSLLVGTLQYVSIFCPDLVENQAFSMSFGCAMIWLFTYVNIRGIKESAFIEVIILFIKILPLIFIALFGVFYLDFSKLIDGQHVGNCSFSSLGAMSGVLLWAFIGLESATVPSDQVENPKKTIPLATIAGVLLTASVYIIGAIVINGLIPYEQLIQSKAPYVDAAKNMFGHYGYVAMIVTGVIGIAGSLNGWILIQGQVPYTAAKNGIFPAYFTKTNKYGAPIGVVIGSTLMTALFLLTYQSSIVKHISFLINASVLMMLIPYFYSVIAFCYMCFLKKEELSLFEKRTLPIVSIVAFIYTFLSILGTDQKLIYFCFIVFLISAIFYCFAKKHPHTY